MAKFNWGKHVGKDYSDPSIDPSYFTWLIERAKKDMDEYQGELDRREAAENASQSMHEQIIKAGYQTLAKKLHPDAGGTTAGFQELQGSYAVLQEIMKEVRGAGK